MWSRGGGGVWWQLDGSFSSAGGGAGTASLYPPCILPPSLPAALPSAAARPPHTSSPVLPGGVVREGQHLGEICVVVEEEGENAAQRCSNALEGGAGGGGRIDGRRSGLCCISEQASQTCKQARSTWRPAARRNKRAASPQARPRTQVVAEAVWQARRRLVVALPQGHRGAYEVQQHGRVLAAVEGEGHAAGAARRGSWRWRCGVRRRAVGGGRLGGWRAAPAEQRPAAATSRCSAPLPTCPTHALCLSMRHSVAQAAATRAGAQQNRTARSHPYRSSARLIVMQALKQRPRRRASSHASIAASTSMLGCCC